MASSDGRPDRPRSRAATPRTVEVVTPHGPARLHRHPAAAGAWATLFLGHGAGGGVEAADLLALAAGLPPVGVDVVAVEQPWRVAGRRVADRPERLDEAWCAAVAAAEPVRGRLLLGGRSAGARVACRTAGRLGAAGVLALAFPLHPPGRAGASRAAELSIDRPLLVVQGDRDPFGRPSEFPAGVPVVAVPGGDHGFAVARSGPLTREEALQRLLAEVRRWLRRLRADEA